MDERIDMEKQQLRTALRQRMAGFSDAYLRASDGAIAAKALALDAWKQAKSVFLYISIGREVDTRGLLAAALKQGKTLAVPLTFPGGKMDARVIQSLAELKPGRMNIPEPVQSAPVLLPKEIDLIIVPCIAADRQGYRLGYGGGYYDRYLESTESSTVCLCRQQLLQDSLPHDRFDRCVDRVITE